MKTISTPTVPAKLKNRLHLQAGGLPRGLRAVRFALSSMRGLIPLDTVCAILSKKPQDILAHIETGQVRWAFDIRSALSRRREVRVFRQSLFELAGLCEHPWNPDGERGEFQELIDQILPLDKTIPARATRSQLLQPAARSADVAECLSCLGQHVHHLIREKSLITVTPDEPAKAIPLVTRASVIVFLQTRRMQ